MYSPVACALCYFPRYTYIETAQAETVAVIPFRLVAEAGDLGREGDVSEELGGFGLGDVEEG
jgi:hypothetical protein